MPDDAVRLEVWTLFRLVLVRKPDGTFRTLDEVLAELNRLQRQHQPQKGSDQ